MTCWHDDVHLFLPNQRLFKTVSFAFPSLPLQLVCLFWFFILLYLNLLSIGPCTTWGPGHNFRTIRFGSSYFISARLGK